jgi:hypothetical protein
MGAERNISPTFVDFEERLSLWDLRAHGRAYWHQIRYPVAGMLQQALGVAEQRQRTFRDRSLRSWLAALPPSYFPAAARRANWFDLDEADVLVVNHPRHAKVGDDWVCPYTSPLLRELDRRYWVIEDVNQGVHAHPQSAPRVRYLEWPLLLAQVGFLLRHGITGGRLDRRERADVGDWIAEMRATFGAAPPLSKALRRTRAGVRELAACDFLYSRLLDRVRPRLVVLVVGYSYRCLPLAALARARGIVVAELQHGNMGATHVAYNFAPGRRPPAFPDYLLTFGDWWRDITPGLPLPAAQCPAFGFAWLEQHGTARSRRPDGGSKTVLFISQSSIGGELGRWALDAAARLDGWTIRFKLHPGEALSWRTRYPWLADAPFEVVDTPTNIYDEFTRADAVVGVYSMAVFEALAFGLPLFIADLPGAETVRPLLDEGGATLCRDPEDLAAAIRTARTPPSAVLDRLWQPNAVANFRAFVDRVLGSSGPNN